MGILPLQFLPGETYLTLGLTGLETFDIEGLDKVSPSQKIQVHVTSSEGKVKAFTTLSRIDTLNEIEYFKNGGILSYVLRQATKSR